MFLFIMSSKLGLPTSLDWWTLWLSVSSRKAGAHPEKDNKIKLAIKYNFTL